jgi:hypothetical protein
MSLFYINQSGTPIDASGSAPASGQVICATSAAAASWQKLPGCRRTLRSLSSNTTISVGDLAFVDCSGGAVTVTLPASPVAGDQVTVKMGASTANNLTIGGNSHNIDGASTLVVSTAYESHIIEYTGTEWLLVS